MIVYYIRYFTVILYNILYLDLYSHSPYKTIFYKVLVFLCVPIRKWNINIIILRKQSIVFIKRLMREDCALQSDIVPRIIIPRRVSAILFLFRSISRPQGVKTCSKKTYHRTIWIWSKRIFFILTCVIIPYILFDHACSALLKELIILIIKIYLSK